MTDGTETAENQDGGVRLTSGDLFAENDPYRAVRGVACGGEASEPNDPNAMALATVDSTRNAGRAHGPAQGRR